MQVLFLYGTRKPKPRIKWTTTQTAMYCETFWLQAFGTRNSSLTNAKVYVLLYSLILFNFEFEGNFQVQAPGGLYLVGWFKGGFFTLRGWGLIFGGAYTWRGLFFRILQWLYGMSVAPCAVISNFFVANSALYSTANDPETANDPRPQVIPKVDRKWFRKKNRNELDSS